MAKRLNELRNILWRFFCIVALGLLVGCTLSPGMSLKEAGVVEGPAIIQRADHYYLRYRRGLEGNKLSLLALVGVKKTDDAAFYFFTQRISGNEWGNLVERPLAYDGTESFARSGRVYWLDPDGTKHLIPVRRED